jgi:hypothetical protein
MPIRVSLFALAIAGCLFAAPAARAADPADFTKFTAACATAGPMLLGDVPATVDTSTIVTPLCSCLVTEFKDFSQPEVDMLTSDLAGTATEDSRKAYTDYEALSSKAGTGLQKCFQTDEVTKAMAAAQPPAPETPAAPTAPAPDAPAMAPAPTTPAPAN